MNLLTLKILIFILWSDENSLTSSSNKIMSASCLFLNSKVTNPIRGYLCTWVIGLCSNDSLLLVAKMVKKNEFISDSVISKGIF